MSEVKNAVLTGKVVALPARKVVEVKKAQPRPEPTSVPGPGKRRDRRDDAFAGKNANAQMLQELNWVKAQLRKAKDDASANATTLVFLAQDAKALCQALEGVQLPDAAVEALKVLGERLGL